MESTSLFGFLKDVSTWPGNQTDFDHLAQKITRLMNARFTIVISHRIGKEVGLSFENKNKVDTFQRGSFAEMIRNQVTTSNELKHSPVRQTELESSLCQAWPVLNSVKNLSIIDLLNSSKRPLALIIVGTEKHLSTTAEIGLVAVSHHLLDLAKVSDLEADLQMRNQFLSIASHELKTPLTSIYGILQLQQRMLKSKKEPPSLSEFERLFHFIAMAIRQVERLNELIDGLLDVSRIQNGRFMIEPSETDVAKLIREFAQTRLDILAREGGVKLHLDTIPQLFAWVDPVRFEEVASNLVTNAIRLSPEGGVVWIKLREDGDSFRFTVRDQGPSISMEDRERIFKPFERLPRTTRMGGLGLGLFISREIAQLHGGNVSLVESVPGKGNVFEAYFPIRHAQAPHVRTEISS